MTFHPNRIYLDATPCGTFVGPLATPYSYRRELQAVIDGIREAAKRSTNRYFVLEGSTVRAAQSTLTGAENYMAADRVLVEVKL